MTFSDRILSQVRRRPWLEGRLRSLVYRASPDRTILLDYPIDSRPRWGHGKAAHPGLYEILDRDRVRYEAFARRLLDYARDFERFPRTAGAGSEEPAWENPMLPSMDAFVLYTLLCERNPELYLEVGSGHSTRFARRAIRDHALKTQIVSIDPEPRAEIQGICDRSIRIPLEDVSLETFDELQAGDIVFVDNSHRVLMNSDATVVFLEILPRLKPGVLVQFHDIFLPYDYPTAWIDRYYSEQYVLAAYLLAGTARFRVVWPGTFVSEDPALAAIVTPLWDALDIQPRERHGVSFWIETT